MTNRQLEQALDAGSLSHPRCNHPACPLCKPRRCFASILPRASPDAADWFGVRLKAVSIIPDMKLPVCRSRESSRTSVLAFLSLMAKGFENRGVIGIVGGLSISKDRFTFNEATRDKGDLPALLSLWALVLEDELEEAEGWIERYYPDYEAYPHPVLIKKCFALYSRKHLNHKGDGFRIKRTPLVENGYSARDDALDFESNQVGRSTIRMESKGGGIILLSLANQ